MRSPIGLVVNPRRAVKIRGRADLNKDYPNIVARVFSSLRSLLAKKKSLTSQVPEYDENGVP